MTLKDKTAFPGSKRDILGGLAAILLGLAAFLLFVGASTLSPTNIGWLNVADRAMHTLGWMFFRAAPWGMPPGASPHLGIELASSIGMVDGLPLFALPLKPLRDWLPDPFQYWGIWLLLSFMLQSLFAYAIARELRASRLLSLVAAAFVLITPAFMFRVPMHLALSGHWTLLAALYLYVRRSPPALWMWPIVVAVTASIHAYLLAMVLALWLAALAERLWTKRVAPRAAVVEFFVALAVTVVVLWTAGFFVSGSMGNYGYGDYKLNLLWPLLTYGHWSQIFPDLPHAKYDYEGLSFLGIGILALLALALAARPRLSPLLHRRWLPLVVVVLAMMVFAFSMNLQLSGVHLGTIPIPRWVSDLASTFRSTGRFVWPLLYLVTIGAVVLVARRFRPAVALPLAVLALAAQAADSAPGLLSFASRIAAASSTWDTPLVSPFWERAASAGYTRIRVVPVQNPGKDWKPLGYFAVTHGMDIDSAYLGRTDEKAMRYLRSHEAEVLATGAFDPHTLYELDVPAALTASAHLAPDDLLAIIDSRIILAKGGAHLVEGLGIQSQMPLGN